MCLVGSEIDVLEAGQNDSQLQEDMSKLAVGMQCRKAGQACRFRQ